MRSFWAGSFIGCLVLFFGVLFSVVAMDPVEEIQRQIDEIQSQLAMSEAATTPLVAEVERLANRIRSAQNSIAQLNQEQKKKEEEIAQQEEILSDQYEVFRNRVDQQYRHARVYSPLVVLLSTAQNSTNQLSLKYNLTLAERDKQTIDSIGYNILNLHQAKEEAALQASRLAALQADLDKQRTFFEQEIDGARQFQQQLEGKIASLTAKQQAIIDARSGSFTFTLGDTELADEYLSSARGFQESAPSGHFAVFSFGGYSHRKGMSQYGARGRAESGQDYKAILQAYYGKQPVEKDTGGNIKVAGHGELNFEDRYLMGIAEMPSSWHMDALKAQAIAARTYALRFKNENREICTTQSCQVYLESKANTVANDPNHPWHKAVKETRGEVLEDVVTFYSSTAGGFLTTLGWDTTDGQGGGSFLERAYERIGNSPWLEKAWWRQGYSVSGSTCGRSNPWLSPEEMADIVNAAIALKTPGIDTSRISPVTTSCWDGNPYSMEELRNLVKDHGGISSATSVSVQQGNGVTNSVTINGVNISGSEFRTAFNLRAPGHLRIPQYPGTYGNPFINVARK